MGFVEKLKLLTQDYNRAAWAKRIGLCPGTLGNIIHRGSTPGFPIAIKIARSLGVDLEWLMDDEQGLPVKRSDRRETAGAFAA